MGLIPLTQNKWEIIVANFHGIKKSKFYCSAEHIVFLVLSTLNNMKASRLHLWWIVLVIYPQLVKHLRFNIHIHFSIQLSKVHFLFLLPEFSDSYVNLHYLLPEIFALISIYVWILSSVAMNCTTRDFSFVSWNCLHGSSLGCNQRHKPLRLAIFLYFFCLYVVSDNRVHWLWSDKYFSLVTIVAFFVVCSANYQYCCVKLEDKMI